LVLNFKRLASVFPTNFKWILPKIILLLGNFHYGRHTNLVDTLSFNIICWDISLLTTKANLPIRTFHTGTCIKTYINNTFKAFKFPESNFVRFEGVVNVCLDTCPGVECSNGQIGFGRKKRNVPTDDVEAQRIYEVSMSTIVKVAQEKDDFGENPLEVSWKNRGKSFKIQNQSYDTTENSRSIPASNPIESESPKERRQVFVERAVLSNTYHHPDDRAITRLSEEFGSYKYIDFEGSSSSTSLRDNFGFRTLMTISATILLWKIMSL
jgi:hypothetical protein